MAAPWGLLVFFAGLLYGYLSPGRQDKSALFKRGLLWGLVVAVVVAVLGWLFNANPLGLGDVGFFGILVSAFVLVLLFIFGAWLGDLLEGRRRTSGPGLRRV